MERQKPLTDSELREESRIRREAQEMLHAIASGNGPQRGAFAIIQAYKTLREYGHAAPQGAPHASNRELASGPIVLVIVPPSNPRILSAPSPAVACPAVTADPIDVETVDDPRPGTSSNPIDVPADSDSDSKRRES